MGLLRSMSRLARATTKRMRIRQGSPRRSGQRSPYAKSYETERAERGSQLQNMGCFLHAGDLMSSISIRPVAFPVIVHGTSMKIGKATSGWQLRTVSTD